jgi:hypothetical protein
MHLIRRIRRAEGGFTMVTVLGILMLGGVLVMGALAAAQPDIRQSGKDKDHKQAYAAAEAGLHYYLYNLSRNNNFWTQCDAVDDPDPDAPGGAPINQRWDGTGTDPRQFRLLPESRAQYAIELLPASGQTTCATATASTNMIDRATGTFRVRATGRSAGPESETRSVVATFKRQSFLDFLYFTDFETLDPAAYTSNPSPTWASTNCRRYRRDNRPEGNGQCTYIVWGNNDHNNGPLHTNDDLMTCGQPTFGRDANDLVEVSAPPQGWLRSPSCSGGDPTFTGTWMENTDVLTMPPSNTSLRTIAQQDGTLYSNTRRIRLEGNRYDLLNANGTVATGGADLSFPANGVLYVQSTSCGSGGYTRVQKYTNPSGCGDVWIEGTYSQDITIATDNDIIIRNDLIASNDAMLGLIANNFVRVYHPATWDGNSCEGNASGGPNPDIRIDAAILALQHSFVVDNWYCGATLGNLTVNGAIAQRFRGPVATGNSSTGAIVTGYVKDYNYDDRLRYRDPPFFLDPVQSQWKVQRQIEQVPATK